MRHRNTFAATGVLAAAVALAACSTDSAGTAASPSSTPAASSPAAAVVEIDERPLEVQLNEAILTGNLPYVEALVAAGVDLEAVNSTGDTALLWAAQFDSAEIVAALLDAGADPTTLGGDLTGSTVLHYAISRGNTDVVIALLDGGADPNLVNREWHATPLMAAAFAGDLDAVDILAFSGADLDAVDANGNSAIDWALSQGHDDVAGYLRDLGAAE